MCLLHHNYRCNIWQPPNIFVLTFENFGCLSLIHFFEFAMFLNYHLISNSNIDDMASSREFYCSLIIRALQISSTIRNLVPRFRR